MEDRGRTTRARSPSRHEQGCSFARRTTSLRGHERCDHQGHIHHFARRRDASRRLPGWADADAIPKHELAAEPSLIERQPEYDEGSAEIGPSRLSEPAPQGDQRDRKVDHGRMNRGGCSRSKQPSCRALRLVTASVTPRAPGTFRRCGRTAASLMLALLDPNPARRGRSSGRACDGAAALAPLRDRRRAR